MKSKVGEAISDCPGCSSSMSVIYHGNNEGVCNSCGSVYEVSFDDEPQTEDNVEKSVVDDRATVNDIIDQIADSADVVDLASNDDDTVVEEKSNVDVGPIGKLSSQFVAPLTSDGSVLKLNQDPIDKMSNVVKDLELPHYITKSRAWKWAHELCRIGNPYRPDTKNSKIYSAIQSRPMTICELIEHVEPELGDKLSFLLIVYEVVTQCIVAGLFVMDSETRKISLCQGAPKPQRMP